MWCTERSCWIARVAMNRRRLLWTLRVLVVLACLSSAGSIPQERPSTPTAVPTGAAAAVAAVTVAAAARLHAGHRVRSNNTKQRGKLLHYELQQYRANPMFNGVAALAKNHHHQYQFPMQMQYVPQSHRVRTDNTKQCDKLLLYEQQQYLANPMSNCVAALAKHDHVQ